MTESQPTLLFGYMVVSSDSTRRGVPGPFLMRAARLHREMNVPCTFFIRGELVRPYQADLQRLRDLCGETADLQQCTFSGLPLKTVCQENHAGTRVFEAPPPEASCDDVARAADAMERLLGERPIGLAGPLGYYRGLADRPDLLYRLSALGVRFLRTYTRNARDWGPLSFEVQPFTYAPQGFADMLELPGQGGTAIEECEAALRRSPERYLRHMKRDLDYVAAKGLVWSAVQHDWCAIQDDPEMHITRAILEYARERNFRLLTHRAFFEERLGSSP